MNSAEDVEAGLERVRSLLKARELEPAERFLEQVLAHDPSHAEAWFLHGVARAEAGDFKTARQSIAKSFEMQPARPAAHRLVYANVLLDDSDPAAAEVEARRALDGANDWAPALVALGIAAHRQGRLEEALALERRALERDPGYVRAHASLAAMLSSASRHGEAVATLRHAVDRWPANAALRGQLAQALWAFARALLAKTRIFDGIDALREALAIDDSKAGWWNDLGNAYANGGLLPEAREAYRAALARDPGLHQVESNLLINLHYGPDLDADAMFEAHRAWATRHAAAFGHASKPRVGFVAEGGRLRIGFVSPTLAEGPTAAFLEPVLTNLDRSTFETHCYAVEGTSDAATERLRSACNRWHDLRGQSDEKVFDEIVRGRIDVLIDLAGHSPGGRLLVLARKPAPVIATWLDYFDTTGLDAVDYLIGDPISTPIGTAQKFTERVIRIEPSRLCYAPPLDAPVVEPPPAVSQGRATFGCFNRISKLAEPVIALWARVLVAVPSSRLLLKSAALVDERLREDLALRFGRHGVEAARIEMRPYSPHREMLREYADVDIVLDPFPFNGGLTTCEALWMGLPVVTLAGDSMIGRQGASLLAAAECPEWIATSPDEYVMIAATLASDPVDLARVRRTQRERLHGSALLDGAAFGRRFGAALEQMWQSAGKP